MAVTTYRLLTCRVWRCTLQCILSTSLTIATVLLVLNVYHQPGYSRSSRGESRVLGQMDSSQRRKNLYRKILSTIPPGSWRLHKKLHDQRWLTTLQRQIFTTQHPLVTTKYFTYIEDFLANWDKYPIAEEVGSRFEAVRDAAVRLKTRKLFSPILTKTQRTAVYELLASFDTLAKREGIRYLAYGGTLLGSFRHHDLIPYDDDVDVIIDDQDRDKLIKAVQHKSATFTISTLSPDHYKLHLKHGQFTNLYHDWTYPYIDISFYKVNQTHLRDLAMTYGKWWEYKLEDIFPLHDRPLGPLMIPAPRDTYRYLRETYDLTVCSESYYSHQLEMVVRCRMVSTDCEKLPYAFVHRSVPTTGPGVNESLILNGRTLHWKIVHEPHYQVNIHNPYTLTFNPT